MEETGQEVEVEVPEQKITPIKERYKSVFGGFLEVTGAKPEHPKTSIPVSILPGWGEDRSVFESYIKDTAKAGRETLFVSHKGLREARFSTETYILPSGQGEIELPQQEIDKAVSFLAFLNEKGIEKTDIIAPSQGSLSALIVAGYYPERVRSVVLLGPAGLIGPDTPSELLKRFSEKNKADALDAIKNPEVRGPILKLFKSGTKFAAKHPIRALAEGVAVGKSDMSDLLHDIKQRENAPKIVIVASTDDTGFPMDRIQQMVKGGDIDGFISARGKHDEVLYNGEFPKIVEGLLTKMEAKQ